VKSLLLRALFSSLMGLEEYLQAAALQGLDNQAARALVHRHYRDLLIDGRAGDIAGLEAFTGIPPGFTDGEIDRGFLCILIANTDLPSKLRRMNAVSELVGREPSHATKQKAYEATMVAGEFSEMPRLLDALRTPIDRHTSLRVYAIIARNSCIDCVVQNATRTRELTGVPPPWDAITVQSIYVRIAEEYSTDEAEEYTMWRMNGLHKATHRRPERQWAGGLAQQWLAVSKPPYARVVDLLMLSRASIQVNAETASQLFQAAAERAAYSSHVGKTLRVMSRAISYPIPEEMTDAVASYLAHCGHLGRMRRFAAATSLAPSAAAYEEMVNYLRGCKPPLMEAVMQKMRDVTFRSMHLHVYQRPL